MTVESTTSINNLSNDSAGDGKIVRTSAHQTELETFAFKYKLLRSHNNFSGTGGTEKIDFAESNETLPIDRIYPHLFDESTTEGQVRIHIGGALKDAQRALNAFGELDYELIGSSLACIASGMAQAHKNTTFNESLGAVVSFIRRATLIASSAEISRSELNALVLVLRAIDKNPMVDIEEAAELIDQLEGHGWVGNHDVTDALISALFDEVDVVKTEDVQVSLFNEHNN